MHTFFLVVKINC